MLARLVYCQHSMSIRIFDLLLEVADLSFLVRLHEPASRRILRPSFSASIPYLFRPCASVSKQEHHEQRLVLTVLDLEHIDTCSLGQRLCT